MSIQVSVHGIESRCWLFWTSSCPGANQSYAAVLKMMLVPSFIGSLAELGLRTWLKGAPACSWCCVLFSARGSGGFNIVRMVFQLIEFLVDYEQLPGLFSAHTRWTNWRSFELCPPPVYVPRIWNSSLWQQQNVFKHHIKFSHLLSILFWFIYDWFDFHGAHSLSMNRNKCIWWFGFAFFFF